MKPCSLLFALGLSLSSFTNAAFAGDWPQFLGAERSSTALEETAISGEVEPEILWQRKLGSGYAGPVVSADRVIVFHRVGGELLTEALAVKDGKELWKHVCPTSYTDSFGFDNGPRAVPCIAEGRVFVHGPEGIVQALDLESGRLLWSYDTAAELNSPQGFFGRACSPLVTEGRVLLNVGGKNAQGGAGIIALEAKTGKLLWQVTNDEAGYSSPILVPEDNTVAAFFTRRGLAFVDTANGQLLADELFRAEMDASVNAAAPVACGQGRVLFSAAYDVGAGLWQWDKTARKLTSLWKKADVLDSHYTTPVHHDGHVYGLHGRQESGMRLRCISVADGKLQWEAPDVLPGGTLIRVGNVMLLDSEDGELWLFKADPTKFDLIRRSQITRAGHRSHAAFSNGLLFARDAEKLVAVRVK